MLCRPWYGVRRTRCRRRPVSCFEEASYSRSGAHLPCPSGPGSACRHRRGVLRFKPPISDQWRVRKESPGQLTWSLRVSGEAVCFRNRCINQNALNPKFWIGLCTTKHRESGSDRNTRASREGIIRKDHRHKIEQCLTFFILFSFIPVHR